MQPYTFNPKSWHARLAFFYGPLTYWNGRQLDMCSYVQSALKGAFVVTLLTVSFGVLFANAVAGTIGVVLLGSVRELDPWNAIGFVLGAGGLGLVVLLALIVAFAVAFDRYVRPALLERQIRKAEQESKPGFIALAFRSWVNRLCVQIQFKESHYE